MVHSMQNARTRTDIDRKPFMEPFELWDGWVSVYDYYTAIS